MNKTKKLATMSITLALLGMLLTQAGCVSTQSTAAEITPSKTIEDIAKDVTQGVGEVRQVNAAGTKGRLIIIEEFHTSCPGRVQNAVILFRLYRKYDVKTVGLEGAFQSDKRLDGTWFQNAGGATARPARESVAIQMLSDCEINQAEFMSLLFPDVVVQGTEHREEHTQPDVKGNPEVVYLLGVAEALMSDADKQKVALLFNTNRKDDAFKLMMNADPWVQHYFAGMGDATDLDVVVTRLHGLQTKAQTLGVTIDAATKREFQNLIRFYELRGAASRTMVAGVLHIMGTNGGKPTAMIIGAAHTDTIVSLLTKENVAFAVVRARDFNPKADSISNEQFDRKGRGQFVWNATGSLGQLLNGEVNPPPVTQTATGRSYANMHLASLLIADASRAQKPLPDALWDELSKLPEVRIDKTSFTKDGYDVIFRAWLKDVNGKEKEVWARVGTTNNPQDTRDLELKLLDADKRFLRKLPPANAGDGGKKGGGGTGSKSTDDHPERSRKGGREITQLGPTALAVFGNTKTAVGAMPRISG